MDPRTKSSQQNYPPFTPMLEPQTPVTNVIKRLNFDTAEQTNDNNTSIIQPTKKKVKTVASRFMLPPSTQKPAKKEDRLNTSMANSSFTNTSFANTSLRAPQPRRTSQMLSTKIATIYDTSAILHPANVSISRAKIPSQVPIAKASTIINDASTISSANNSSNVSILRSKTSKALPPMNIPTGTVINSNNFKIMRRRLELIQNVLLQYCFCNAKGKKLLDAQNEKSKRVMLAASNKVHELREEVHKHKLQLSQKQYLSSLDAILTLQENNLLISQIDTTLQYYQTITTSIFTSLNLMPLGIINPSFYLLYLCFIIAPSLTTKDMQVQPGLLKTISNISDTLMRIQQGIALTEREEEGASISSAAQSIESIAQSVPQQILLLDDCKLLIKILTGIENQLTSLHIEAIEERLFDEMFMT